MLDLAAEMVVRTVNVCCDPGHGLPDPGAVGKRSQEHEIVLQAAICLRDELTRLGHQVVMTRRTESALDADKSTDLAKRCRISNESGADCFVSLHCNSAADSAANGWEIFHHGQSARGKALAEAIHQAVQTAGIVRSGGDDAPEMLRDRGVKIGDLYVLKHTRAPAVLVELGFVSNEADEAKLLDYGWIQRHMVAVAQGIEVWGGKFVI